MFSKNIIALLCVVCFIEKSNTTDRGEITETFVSLEGGDEPSTSMQRDYEASTITVSEIPRLNNTCTTEQWKEIFNKYDNKNSGNIPVEVLQKLIYDEFGGFLTIRQAKEYTYLINLKKNYKIGLEQLEKMKPIIAVLTQRESSKNNKKVNKNNTVTSEDFVNEIANTFHKLFEKDTEGLQDVVNFIGQYDKFPIQLTRFEEIKKMLKNSAKMNDIHAGFCLMDKDNDGVINYADLATDNDETDSKEATMNDINTMIKAQDLNGDGVIDLHEYIMHMIMINEPTQKLEGLELS